MNSINYLVFLIFNKRINLVIGNGHLLIINENIGHQLMITEKCWASNSNLKLLLSFGCSFGYVLKSFSCYCLLLLDYYYHGHYILLNYYYHYCFSINIILWACHLTHLRCVDILQRIIERHWLMHEIVTMGMLKAHTTHL